MKKTIVAVMTFLVLSWISIYFGNDIIILFENEKPSKSIGITSSGSLLNGKRIPSRGDNFKAYSYTGALLGRNSVCDKLRKTILDTYRIMNNKFPEKKFVYGETGWPRGGKFWPHKTHQNGLCVDFMVPIFDINGKSKYLPGSLFNRFGYGMEFDSQGMTAKKKVKIDFEIMAAHLYELHTTAKGNGIYIHRVIFDPGLQSVLLATESGRKIKKLITFSKRKSWIRHDEHYHVDFRLEK